MLLHVKSVIYEQIDVRHEYRLNDGSTAIEQPKMPGNSRWLYYSGLNRRIFNKSAQKAIRDAVERYKKRFKCK